jgi:cation:H+ antiporter
VALVRDTGSGDGLPFIGQPSLGAAVALFCAATVAIVVAGTRLTGVADVLAERTGLGEAVMGEVLLGGSTSLSGIVTSVTAASNGSAELAVSNAVGGIAVQTVFLAVADLAYRGVNLEHAAASPANLAQGALLVTLLAVPLLAFSGPEVSLLGVHPATPLLLASYAFGLRVVSDVQADPMWGAKRTPETQDEEEESSKIAVPRARA